MSGFQKLPHWFMRDYPMDPHERLVYLTLRSHTDKHGVAWPSRSTLAKESGLSETTVKNRLKALEAHGLIRVTIRPNEGKKHDPNLYHVLELSDDGPGSSVAFSRLGSPDDPSGVARRPQQGSRGDHEEEPPQEEPDEEDLRPEQGFGRDPSPLGTFIDPQEPSTKAQHRYLSDLQVHLNRVSPDEELLEYWGDLTKQQATDLINAYLRQIPRKDAYDGPEIGEAVYEQLSERGREFADRQMLPENQSA
ncbi:helix-turn-helix domain-containing protein [Curtobacterium flaccumfaciens]|uniref:helix-turn-helix domain-containing protein n=1 Tax=Curtobacterium flaccumfaciens TaxID=2035 RepID=UPI00188B4FE3|nr:helix-turn-helix domain-containing protein [Curtobacterium flaccumfaciens]MBF4595365.1 helix-turn-helix domain-containing protein [Curtobacterium flaccumfaciens]